MARMVLGQDEADGVNMTVVSTSNPFEGETYANWFGNLLIIIDKREGLKKRYNNHFFSSLIEIDFGWLTIEGNLVCMRLSCLRISSSLGDYLSLIVLMNRLSNVWVDCSAAEISWRESPIERRLMIIVVVDKGETKSLNAYNFQSRGSQGNIYSYLVRADIIGTLNWFMTFIVFGRNHLAQNSTHPYAEFVTITVLAS